MLRPILRVLVPLLLLWHAGSIAHAATGGPPTLFVQPIAVRVVDDVRGNGPARLSPEARRSIEEVVPTLPSELRSNVLAKLLLDDAAVVYFLGTATADVMATQHALERALQQTRETNGPSDPSAGIVLLGLSLLEEQRRNPVRALLQLLRMRALTAIAQDASAAQAHLKAIEQALERRQGEARTAVEASEWLVSHSRSRAGASSRLYGAALSAFGIALQLDRQPGRACALQAEAVAIVRATTVPISSIGSQNITEMMFEMTALTFAQSNLAVCHGQAGNVREAIAAVAAADQERDKAPEFFFGAKGRDLAKRSAIEAFAVMSLELGAGQRADAQEMPLSLRLLFERKGAGERQEARLMRNYAATESIRNVVSGGRAMSALPGQMGTAPSQEEYRRALAARSAPLPSATGDAGATPPSDDQIAAMQTDMQMQILVAEQMRESLPALLLARQHLYDMYKKQLPADSPHLTSLREQIQKIQQAMAAPPVAPSPPDMQPPWSTRHAPSPEAMSIMERQYETLRKAIPADSPQLKLLRDRIDRMRQMQQAAAALPPSAPTGVPELPAIQSRLARRSVLLEMVLHTPLDPDVTRPLEQRWSAPRYGSFVILPEGSPLYVDLGEAQPIDRLVARLRRSLADPRTKDSRELGKQLYARLLRPLRASLGDVSLLVLAPDGLLNLVPFAALVDDQGRYLVESVTLNHLTSARDLLRQGAATAPPRAGAVIVADAAFGSISSAQPGESSGQRSIDYATMRFDALPGTAAEAEGLQRIIPDARLITGEQATETAIKALAGPRLLHIATHGFFLKDRPRDPDAPQAGENPMLRAGLVFAGVNRLRSGNDDGVLTALEATGLDLAGTQLVVLSACETGVGDVSNGEGVFGLRRAFVVAGAQTLVMSLWQVEDESTKDLMLDYYGRLARGEARNEALRQSQLALMANQRYAHPFFWAAFISSGEADVLPQGNSAVR